jgi:hypothetical protein
LPSRPLVNFAVFVLTVVACVTRPSTGLHARVIAAGKANDLPTIFGDVLGPENITVRDCPKIRSGPARAKLLVASFVNYLMSLRGPSTAGMEALYFVALAKSIGFPHIS